MGKGTTIGKIKNSIASRNRNIHETSIIEKDAIMGENVSVAQFSRIMSMCTIGNETTIGQNVFIDNNVSIGNYCNIQNNVCLIAGVQCMDNVYIGASVIFTDVFYAHLRASVNAKRELQHTIIEKGVTIGANSTIICGVNIGAFAFIAAGSLIINDVRPYALISGNPAKQIGWMSEHGTKLNFLNKDRIAVCSKSGYAYKLEKNHVYKIDPTHRITI
jgi:UDP-2-acetamido-3-amino-2,3-dideoxy-glucuronate N-acetyltransferase